MMCGECRRNVVLLHDHEIHLDGTVVTNRNKAGKKAHVQVCAISTTDPERYTHCSEHSHLNVDGFYDMMEKKGQAERTSRDDPSVVTPSQNNPRT